MEHCRTVGRDEREIERTVELQRVVIRDTRARRRCASRTQVLAFNGGAAVDEDRPKSGRARGRPRLRAAPPTTSSSSCRPYVELGYRHLICGFPAPYDEESMTRIATEVRPRLEALIG